MTDDKPPTSQVLQKKLKASCKPAAQNCCHAFVYPVHICCPTTEKQPDLINAKYKNPVVKESCLWLCVLF